VQSVADVELVRKLPPSVFWPRPQVVSAIVLIRPSTAKRAHVGDAQRFRVLLRDLYAHRRKNLRGALAGLAGHPFSKEQIDRQLAELGIDGSVRAETLDTGFGTGGRLTIDFGFPVATSRPAPSPCRPTARSSWAAVTVARQHNA
jgi:hypothetical protein